MKQRLLDRLLSRRGRERARSRSACRRPGCGRALAVVLWLVVVPPVLLRPAALHAAEAAPDSSLFLAQTQPKKSASDLRMRTRPGASRTPAGARSEQDSASPEEPLDEDTAAAEPADSEPSPGLFRSLIQGIRRHAVWIVIILVCAIAGVLVWVLMGRTSPGAFEDELEGTGPAAAPAGSTGEKKYSTTKIQAREVNDRLALDSTEVETDREYALVVDEEALKKPEVDERTGQVYADASEIKELLEARRFDDAYETYTNRLRGAEVVEFHSAVERALAEHFLESRDFDKAARVLEHHLATHAAADIAPDAYFNLGYIHFFDQKVNKSRRFLELYVERETDRARADRARRILEALGEATPG